LGFNTNEGAEAPDEMENVFLRVDKSSTRMMKKKEQ